MQVCIVECGCEAGGGSWTFEDEGSEQIDHHEVGQQRGVL
jgi:hypothetical protein